MLFINFEKPHRVRLQGIANVDENDSPLSEYAEAQLIVRVRVTEVFRNCPRYVHRYKKIQPSEFVPRSTCETPLAPWKRVDDIQTSLPARIVLASNAKAICSREQSMRNTSAGCELRDLRRVADDNVRIGTVQRSIVLRTVQHLRIRSLER